MFGVRNGCRWLQTTFFAGYGIKGIKGCSGQVARNPGSMKRSNEMLDRTQWQAWLIYAVGL
jgi:hypothetical protein